MLKISILSFISGLIVMLLGAYEVAGVTLESAKAGLLLCIGVAVITFLVGIARGPKE